ncbi:MAG: HNH endonuclease signature motif containing protein [Ktedonobacteraceae bacterium]
MGWSRNRDPFLRFNERIIKTEGGCWFWQGKLSTHGYGQFKIDGQVRQVHRWSYEAFKSPIPEGLILHHRCENRCCVNPDHLEPVTVKENNAYTNQRCRQGHSFTTENTIVTKTGVRICRFCHEGRLRKYKRHSDQLRHCQEQTPHVEKTFLVFAPDTVDTSALLQALEDLKQRGLILDFLTGDQMNRLEKPM